MTFWQRTIKSMFERAGVDDNVLTQYLYWHEKLSNEQVAYKMIK
jgi:hypothetical protein